MNDFTEKILSRAESVTDFHLLSSSDIPKIDLYMEQVTSLLEQEMGDSLRRKDECVFTNTMINNYSKDGVLPRPQNKRYNRRHILTLIYIFLLKQNLQIPEIKRFTSMIESAEQLDVMYDIFYEIVAGYSEQYLKNVEEKIDLVERKFAARGIEDDEMLTMTVISLLSIEAKMSTNLSTSLLNLCEEERAGRTESEE